MNLLLVFLQKKLATKCKMTFLYKNDRLILSSKFYKFNKFDSSNLKCHNRSKCIENRINIIYSSVFECNWTVRIWDEYKYKK